MESSDERVRPRLVRAAPRVTVLLALTLLSAAGTTQARDASVPSRLPDAASPAQPTHDGGPSAALARVDAAAPGDAAASGDAVAQYDAAPGDDDAAAGDASWDDAGRDVEPEAATAIVPTLALPPPPPSTLRPGVGDAPPPPVRPVPVAERPWLVVKAILGLVALLTLAYAGGHPSVQRLERQLGITQVVTAGFPFVALGLIARLPAVGVLTDTVLAQMGPLLRFGLGWIGFVLGFRFDARQIEAAPGGVASFVATRALVSFVVIVAAAALVLVGARGLSQTTLSDPVFLRDALILGTAGSLTSLAAPRLLAARGGAPRAVELVEHVVRLEEITGVVGLLIVAAYFRPQGTGVTWQLPGTAWLLLTVGLGAAVGGLLYAILLRTPTKHAEEMVLILGSVAFAAGMASQLRLSPLVVCFVAGLVLVNFPGHYRAHLRATLAHLERPIYLVFLVVVGALWQVGDGRGWALMVVFVAARLAGKWLGVRVGARQADLALPPDAGAALAIAPMGALSIAIVIGAQILYPGGSISWIVTAVVGGAIVTEVLVQALSRRAARRGDGPSLPPPPGPEPL